MRIAILPTGKLELNALGDALGRLFPGHDFFPIPRIFASKSAPAEPFDGFTSNPLRPTAKAPGKLVDLLKTAAAHAYPGRTRNTPPADHVLIVDDLELCNAHQPGVVVDTVKQAARERIQWMRAEEPTLSPRVEKALREQVSFHLIAPMIESWLFADPSGPARAGVPAGHLPFSLAQGIDPEEFTTADPAYSADNGEACAELLARARKKNKQAKPRDFEPPWVVHNPMNLPRVLREHHPKGYLCWLCRDPAHERCSTYREIDGGVRSLAALDWASVLKNQGQMTYLRSLVADVADMLGTTIPGGMGGQEAVLTSLSHRPPDHALRNL